MIRWNKQDSKNLNSTLRKFNNKIRRLEKQGISNLPKEVSYADIKSKIYSRVELNRVLSSYGSFLKSGSERMIKLNENEYITKWEKSFLSKQEKIAKRYLTEKLTTLTDTLGTGNTTKNEIRATIESITEWKTKSGTELARIKERIITLGNKDFEYYQASIFQKNFIKAYRKMGRKEIVNKAREFKDPVEFWEWIKNSELVDIQLRYDVESNTLKLAMDKDDSYYYELFKLGLFSS